MGIDRLFLSSQLMEAIFFKIFQNYFGERSVDLTMLTVVVNITIFGSVCVVLSVKDFNAT